MKRYGTCREDKWSASPLDLSVNGSLSWQTLQEKETDWHLDKYQNVIIEDVCLKACISFPVQTQGLTYANVSNIPVLTS